MVSGIEKSLGGHLKTVHFATEMCDVCGEVSIFVAFLSVSSVNVPLSWACKFIKVYVFLVIVNDHNVRLLRSHTELRWNRTTSWCRVPRQVTVHCVLFID